MWKMGMFIVVLQCNLISSDILPVGNKDNGGITSLILNIFESKTMMTRYAGFTCVLQIKVNNGHDGRLQILVIQSISWHDTAHKVH